MTESVGEFVHVLAVCFRRRSAPAEPAATDAADSDSPAAQQLAIRQLVEQTSRQMVS